MPTPEPEMLDFAISRQWLTCGQPNAVTVCVIHTPNVMDRPAIDYWTNLMRECSAGFPAGGDARFLHDMTLHTRRIPYYVQQQARTLYEELAGRHRYYGAFVVPDMLFHPLLNAIRSAKPDALKRPDSPITECIFTDYDSALGWLCAVGL